jgi:hypothetical protein
MEYREDAAFGILQPVYPPHMVIHMEINPLGCSDAYDYFRTLYQKALGDRVTCFLGWVDPDTIEPLDYAEEDEDQ